MKDKFEIFVKDAVTGIPPNSIDSERKWLALDKQLRRRTIQKRIVKYSLAATVLIMVSLSVIMISRQQNHSSDYYADALAEVNEASFYYACKMDEMYDQIAQFENLDHEYFQLFYDELEQLDKEYEQYLQDAQEFGFQEEILRALICTQRQKLLILNRLLEEITKVKDYESKKYSI